MQMKFDVDAVKQYLRSFDFKTLFLEQLGWDIHRERLNVRVDDVLHGEVAVRLDAVAHKRGFVAFVCEQIPESATRVKIDYRVTKSVREHFAIYTSSDKQLWHWVHRRMGKPSISHEIMLSPESDLDSFVHRLSHIVVSIKEEGEISLLGVIGRVRKMFEGDVQNNPSHQDWWVSEARERKYVSDLIVLTLDADEEWDEFEMFSEHYDDVPVVVHDGQYYIATSDGKPVRETGVSAEEAGEGLITVGTLAEALNLEPWTLAADYGWPISSWPIEAYMKIPKVAAAIRRYERRRKGL